MKLANTNISKLLILIGMSITVTNGTYAQVWTLEQCVDSVKINNKRLKISKNNIQIVEQKQKEVKANLLPKITATGDYKYYTNLPTQLLPLSIFGGPEGQYKDAQFGVNHNINAGLQFSMPLYKPEIYGGIEASKIAIQLSNLQLQKTSEQLYFDVVNLYYNAQIIKNQISFLDSNLINSKALLENVKLLNQQLMIQQTDVDKVELQVQLLTSKILILESKYDQVINGLKLYMGVSLDQVVEIEKKVIKSETIEYKIQHTVDFQLIKTRLGMLFSELKTLKKTRYLPSAYLYGYYGALGYGHDKSPNEFLNFYAIGFVGVKLSYPIFNGTVTNKKINQKRLEIKNNELQKGLVKDQQEMQIKNAQLNKSMSEKTMEQALLQIELAKKIYNQTILKQGEGVANLTDVLLADNAIREAQQSYLSSIINYLKAELEIKKITGNIK